MRTTLNIDDALLKQSAKLTGVEEQTSRVRLGLEALISKEAASGTPFPSAPSIFLLSIIPDMFYRESIVKFFVHNSMETTP